MLVITCVMTGRGFCRTVETRNDALRKKYDLFVLFQRWTGSWKWPKRFSFEYHHQSFILSKFQYLNMQKYLNIRLVQSMLPIIFMFL